MEAMDIISQIINNCGFPIAAFVMMWIQNRELAKSLNSNTEVLTSLKSIIESKFN